MGWLISLLTGGIVKQFTDPLLKAYERKLEAQNEHERLEADKEIARLENARDIALAEASEAFSATRIGRLLIIVPFGIWWSAVFFVSIVNPLFGLTLTIDDIPPRFWEIAVILIPAIIIGDAGALISRRMLIKKK